MLVRRYLNLDEAFEEATDEKLTSFFSAKSFEVADQEVIVKLADSWVRRKVAWLASQKILESVQPEDIAKVGTKFGIEVEIVGSGKKAKLVVPAAKKELKTWLRLLSEDFLEGALTATKYRANSKRPM